MRDETLSFTKRNTGAFGKFSARYSRYKLRVILNCIQNLNLGLFSTAFERYSLTYLSTHVHRSAGTSSKPPVQNLLFDFILKTGVIITQ